MFVKKQNVHLLRQFIVTFSSCLLSISAGVTLAYSGVLLPKLKKDQDFPYDEGLDSWIASAPPLAMTVGCIFTGATGDSLGRKNGQLFITPFFVLGWFIMGFAQNNTMIILGRFITGACTGAVRPSTMVYIGEITSPKYRSIALVCPMLAAITGVLISHVVGNTFHWRTSCFVFGTPNILCFIILLFLTESPLWLLGKGRMEEGLKSFKFFRGEDEAAQKELVSVLEKKKEKSNEISVKRLLQIIFSKMFMKALATTFFLFCATQLSGVTMISFYALVLFENLFGNYIDPYILTLIIDCVRIIVSILVCLFANIFPRRITFLFCCLGTTIFLILLSIFFFVQPSGLSWLGLVFFISYVMLASAAANLAWPFLAEIFPNNLRAFGSGLGGAISCLLLFMAVKVTPGISRAFGDATLYGMFSVTTLLNLVILCFMLPETNGKSLQDIENSLYGNKDEKSNRETYITRI